jgi:predicted nucleotidyltransferase
MLPEILEKQDAIAAICRRYGVARLEVFGLAAQGVGFDPVRSDADFLVTFEPTSHNDLTVLLDLQEALERLLGRPVDLVEREAVEASRNYIRRRAILKQARTVYG